MNFQLITCIFSALYEFENNHGWDLSVGENARLAESFYRSFEASFPTCKDTLVAYFETAYIFTWGYDHTCDAVSNEELKVMIDAVMFDDRNYNKLISELSD